jgi:hypothetical protein
MRSGTRFALLPRMTTKALLLCILMCISATAAHNQSTVENSQPLVFEESGPAVPREELRKCLPDIVGGLTSDGRYPKYWAQRLLIPRDYTQFYDDNLYLTKNEITFGDKKAAQLELFGDVIAYDHPDFQCLRSQGNGSPVIPGSRENHASCVAGLMCSNGSCSFSPGLSATHLFMETTQPGSKSPQSALYRAAKIVIDYNRSVPTEKKIRTLNVSLGPGNGVVQVRHNAFIRKDFVGLMKSLNREDEINVILSTGPISGSENFSELTGGSQNIIPVGSVDAIHSFKTDGVLYGQGMGFVAPGGKPGVQLYDSDGGKNSHGSSYSAAIVSACFVEVNRVNPGLDATTAREIVSATATPLGEELYFGHGLPNPPLTAAVARAIRADKVNGKDISDVKREVQRVLRDQLAKMTFGVEDNSQTILSQSQDCKDYASRLDRLVARFLRSGRNARFGNEICRVFEFHDFEWGILNYCGTKELKNRLGLDKLCSNPLLFSRIGTHAKEIFSDEGEAESCLNSAMAHDRKIATRDILSSSTFYRTYPDVWRRRFREMASTPWGAKDNINHFLVLEYLAPQKWLRDSGELTLNLDVLKTLSNAMLLTRSRLGAQDAINHPDWGKWIRAMRPMPSTYELLAEPAATKRSDWVSTINDVIDRNETPILDGYIQLANPNIVAQKEFPLIMERMIQRWKKDKNEKLRMQILAELREMLSLESIEGRYPHEVFQWEKDIDSAGVPKLDKDGRLRVINAYVREVNEHDLVGEF